MSILVIKMTQGPFSSPEANDRAQLVSSLLNSYFPSPYTSEMIRIIRQTGTVLGLCCSLTIEEQMALVKAIPGNLHRATPS